MGTNQSSIAPSLKNQSIASASPVGKMYPQTEKLLRLRQVLALFPVGRSTLYSLVATGKFPKQLKLGGGRSVAWRESEVAEFIANLEEA